MTANIPITLVNVLALAFVAVVAIGVGFLAYAANQLKKCEEEAAAPKSDA